MGQVQKRKGTSSQWKLCSPGLQDYTGYGVDGYSLNSDPK